MTPAVQKLIDAARYLCKECKDMDRYPYTCVEEVEEAIAELEALQP